MNTAYLGLGSNIGDHEKNIRSAVNHARERCEISEKHPVDKNL